MASLSAFKKAGNIPTLLSAFLYFDVSFMVWVILGPLGPFIGEAYKLTATQKGLLTAVPLLGGSFCRPILGWSTERFGGRMTGLAGMTLTLIPLLIGWKFAGSFEGFIAMGLLLGIAGASFAAALPLASGWYPPEHQGLAMGIAGAGNSGTLLATLFAPRLAQAFGWRSVFVFAAVPIIIVWILFFLLAKDAPIKRRVKRWSDYLSVLTIGDSYYFCFLYCLTFGGFSGLVSYLSIFFHDQYHLSKVQSGDFTTFVVIFGSFLRPVGGVLADRLGGYRMLVVLLFCTCLSLGIVAMLPPVFVTVGVLVLAMSSLGMGNGSVFQLVPQRFPSHVGIMTGIVGAAGGFGGFLLPALLGFVKDKTGSFMGGYGTLACCYLLGGVALLVVKRVWARTWPTDAAYRAGILTGPRVGPKVEIYAARS